MKNKITQLIPAILALVVIGFRYFSLWCIFTTRVCYSTVIDHVALSVTQPLYNFSLFFLPIALILIFIPRHLFNSWLKFAAWTLPILLILVATQPVVSSFLSTNRDDAARLAGQVFAGASLLLIIYKWITSANPSKPRAK
ncbi:MAG: hypothetical protein WC798_02245 [Candidatus Paceibacterota bacterium]